jgi:uncharacterized Fe-S cluster protein YjdI
MGNVMKKYTKENLTVVWKPEMCIHSAICFRGLPNVFDPRKRPWVNVDAASKELIMQQIDQCPSKALSYQLEAEL